MAEIEKVMAVRGAFNLGAATFRKANSPRGWSKTAQVELERSARAVLTTVLGRKPTQVEVDAAMAKDDEPRAFERLREQATSKEAR